MDLTELKASIRGILLSLGKTATEQEFRNAYYESENESFNEVLKKFKSNFYDLFLKMPDVAKVLYANNMVFIQRVSNEETSHMDNLTINKYAKKYRGPKLVAKSGALKIPVRSFRPNFSYNINSRLSNAYNGHTKTSQSNVNIRDVNRDVISRNSQFVKSYGNNSSALNTSKNGSSGSVLRPYYPRNSKTTVQITSISSPKKENVLSIDIQNNASGDWDKNSSTTSNESVKTQYKNINSSDSSFKNDNTTSTSSYIRNKQNNSTAPKISKISPIKYPGMVSSSLKQENAIAIGAHKNALNDWDKNSDRTLKASEKVQSNGTSSTSYFNTSNERIIDVKEDSKIIPAKPKPVASTSKLIPPNILKDKKAFSKSILVNSKDTVDSIIDKIGDLKLENVKQKKTIMVSETLNHENDVSNRNNTEVSKSNKKHSGNLPILSSDLAKNRIGLLRSIYHIIKENERKDDLNDKKVSNVSTFSKIINSTVILPPVIFDENNRLFEIKILDIVSPSKFTFQFSLDNIKELTMKMERFYNNLQDIDNYRMDKLALENIVAIRHNDSWYRGQIISVDNSKVSVQNVDALKVVPLIVPPKDIFHLHPNFTAESPKSAYGRIHGLKSSDDVNWNILGTSKMMEFQRKDIWAIYKSVENGVFALSLVAKMGGFKRIIDEFIEENLAEIDPSDFTENLIPQISLQD